VQHGASPNEGFVAIALLLAPVAAEALVIPEPGTWAMLIAGFGLMDAAVRRRADRLTTTRA
jgi:hypothetical protein